MRIPLFPFVLIFVAQDMQGQLIDTISLKGTYYSTSSIKEEYVQKRKIFRYSLGRYIIKDSVARIVETEVSATEYYAHKDSTDNYYKQLGKCKPCWQKNYSFQGRLLSEGLVYLDCIVGDFISYYSNGQIYIKSSFAKNETSNWSDLYGRDLCGQNGNDRFYTSTGKLIKTQFYINGKITNCVDE